MDLAFMQETFLDASLDGLPLTLNLACHVGRARRGPGDGAGARCACRACRSLDWLARAYVFVFRGTPLLVQIFLIYYGLGQFRPTLAGLGSVGLLPRALLVRASWR